MIVQIISMKENLIDLTANLFRKKTDNNRNYYLLSIRHDVRNVVYASFFSRWEQTINSKQEKRCIDLVNWKRVSKAFVLSNQKLGTVETETELAGALRLGGHFFIESTLMQEKWPEVLTPKLVVSTYDKGYLDYNLITKQHLTRYARGTFRMDILDRDGLRCRVCGRNPDHALDLTLEVHHIKPWQEGGLTEPSNLITLCSLCHSGINLVNRHLLYEKIGIHFPLQNHLLYEPSHPLLNIIYNSVVFKIDPSIIKDE